MSQKKSPGVAKKTFQFSARIVALFIFIPLVFISMFAGTYVFLREKNVTIEIPWVSENLSFLLPKFIVDDLNDSQDYLKDRTVLVNRGKAPEITGVKQWFNGKPTSLSDLKGRVVIISFDQLYCGHCLNNFTYYNDWAFKYHGALEIISLFEPAYEDGWGDPDSINEVIRQRGVDFRIGLDETAENITKYSQDPDLPQVFVIDQTGDIRYRYNGIGSFTTIETAVKELLDR